MNIKDETIIWTEIINCAEVGAVMLKSFNDQHPDWKLHIFCTSEDQKDIMDNLQYQGYIEPIGKENPFIFILVDNTTIADSYQRGHEGTARVFAEVIAHKDYNVRSFPELRFDYKYAIHIDSDIFIKAPLIEHLLSELDVNVSAVGSRRAYSDNLGGAQVNGPDTISTYCMGIKIHDVQPYEFEYFVKMCQGVVNPVGFDTLDFFDPVSHSLSASGKAVKFLDPALYGGQFVDRKGKFDIYKSNAHLDMGEFLCHFGGAGSGCAYFNGKSKSETHYMNWAISRYNLFHEMFYLKALDCSSFNVPKSQMLGNRWVNGLHTPEIFNQILLEIKDSKQAALREWFKSDGDTKLRMDHNLPFKAMVWDVGAYIGEWAKDMHAKYGCEIICYEPVHEFYFKCKETFSQNTSVIVEPYALGETRRNQLIQLDKDASSLFLKTTPETIADDPDSWIAIEDIAKEFTYEKTNKKTKQVDLLKLNVEGAEYEIFDRIFNAKLSTRFNEIMVQFHDHVPEYEKLYMNISEKLSVTHDLKWRFPFVWEKWVLKSKFRK